MALAVDYKEDVLKEIRENSEIAASISAFMLKVQRKKMVAAFDPTQA